MLKIYFGDLEEAIYNTSMYFDNTFEAEWLEPDIIKQLIKDIDKSDVLSPYCIESPVLGQIPPYLLAGGTKTLILMFNEPETIYNGSTCGDNCAKWMLEIGKRQDVTVNFFHLMNFGIEEEFEIEILNNHEIVHNMEELMPHAFKYLGEEGKESEGSI